MILTGPVSNLRTSDLDANDHNELIVTGSRTMDLYGTPEPGAPLTPVARLTLDKRIP